MSRGSEYAQHGADWAMGRCESRTAQSPINFVRLDAPPAATFGFEYQPVTELTLEQDAGGWFAALPPLGEVSFRGERYALHGLRVHAGSEHTFAGERRAAELVLEHRLIDETGLREERTLFVSFTLTSPHEAGAEPLPEEGTETDADYNPSLELLIETMPLPKEVVRTVANPDHPDNQLLLQRNASNASNASNATNATNVTAEPGPTLDVAAVVLSGGPDLAFMAYEGSSTRPPCGSAAWLVKRAPVRVSSAQLDHLVRSSRSAVADNWRTVMPVGFDRTVEVMRPEEGLPKAGTNSGAYRLPSGPNPRTDGELRSIFKATKANNMARELGKTTADLDKRVQRAAVAHRQAFAPTTVAPVDWGFGRLNAKDALKIAETISGAGTTMAWDLAHQIQSMNGAVEDAANTAANVTATRIGNVVKEWYMNTPPPPPPPKPTPCPTACVVDADCAEGTCEMGLCCITCLRPTKPPPAPKKGKASVEKEAEAIAEAADEGAAANATGTTAVPETIAPTTTPPTTAPPAQGTTVGPTTLGPTTPGVGGTTPPPGATTYGPTLAPGAPTTPGAPPTTPPLATVPPTTPPPR